jgi:hypothetical protein
VECDLPGPDEELGAMLTTREDIEEFIEENRELILDDQSKPN